MRRTLAATDLPLSLFMALVCAFRDNRFRRCRRRTDARRGATTAIAAAAATVPVAASTASTAAATVRAAAATIPPSSPPCPGKRHLPNATQGGCRARPVDYCVISTAARWNSGSWEGGNGA